MKAEASNTTDRPAITGCTMVAAAFCVASMSSGSAQAMGLSDISQQSALGEPLRLVIPIIGNAADQFAGDELAGECFKVVSPTTNDVPQLNNARLTLERKGAEAFVVLTTAYAIHEPIMRVAVQAGCPVQISREYTVLFDPVSIEPPAVQLAAAPASQLSERGNDASAETHADKAAEAPIAASTARSLQRASPPSTKRSSGSSRGREMTPGTSQRLASAAGVASPPSSRAAKTSAAPRLQISKTIGDATATRAATTPKNVAEREALAALEEQTVVLQRQIAELSRQMERLDAELRVAQAARSVAEKKAAVAATRPSLPEQALASTPSTWRAWLADNWPMLVFVPVLITLVAALARQWRSQRPLVPRPLTATQAASFNAADLGEPSVPNPEAERDREALAASMKDRPRGHMIPPVFVDPIEPDKPAQPGRVQTHYEYDPGISVADMNVEDVDFDEEVRKAHEQASEYSLLEREEPGIVARLVESWGTSRTTAQLDNYLLAPRRSGRPLSLGAMEELKLLRSIAMEQVADLNSGIRTRLGNLRTPAGTIAGTH